jgi:DNA polymerase-3 subunit beta
MRELSPSPKLIRCERPVRSLGKPYSERPFSLTILRIQANNPDQEEARDELEVEYRGEAMEIGFNVNYLLDALAAVGGEQVEVGFVDSSSSCLISCPGEPGAKYVVMPMRL